MCGIFGVLDIQSGRVPDRSRLDATVEILDHRGPDDRGVYVDDSVGLAFTRLALLDLNPRSSQPFWDESGRYCLVYNGEVYNFISLREKLQDLGVKFKTTSDTEVVLQSLISLETDEALRSFEGMFAIGLWDRHKQRLTLARDQLGIKPLFVAELGKRLYFSSELQAFRPWIDLTEDTGTIVSFLYGSGGSTRGRTFFEDVRYLSPGSVLTVDTSGFRDEHMFHRVSEFWDQEKHRELASLPDSAAIDRVEEALLRSVEMQLVADAPVGALCSGGVDSSLVLAMAARSHTNLTIFHADLVGSQSEYDAAARVARHLDLDLQVEKVIDDDFLDLLPTLTTHHGFPFHLNPHSVPFFKVTQLVRQTGVKAVLTGEGADEVFLGYPWLVPGRTQRRSNKTASRPSTTFLGPADEEDSNGRFVGRVHGEADARQIDILTDMFGGFETLSERNENVMAASQASDRTNQQRVLQSLDLLNSNLRGLLHRNDTMGMASSIESRFPFLDSELISLGINLGANTKIRRGFVSSRPTSSPL